MAGTITLSRIPVAWIAPAPAAAQAAPTRPPISACDELEGRPSDQVTRFHAIAPSSAANTTLVVVAEADTIPLAIVVATLSEMNAPTKLSTAEYVTAMRGRIARVEIEAATALAVSWKPFVKSNASAVTITTTSRA